MNNIMNNIIKKNDLTVIAVDHGFGNIKTAHCCFRVCFQKHKSERKLKKNAVSR